MMRWNKQYDVTKEALTPESHRTHSPHFNAHTEQEIKRSMPHIKVIIITSLTSSDLIERARCAGTDSF